MGGAMRGTLVSTCLVRSLPQHRPETSKGVGQVGLLGSLRRRPDAYPGREMMHAYGTRRLVDVLTTGASSSAGRNDDVVFRYRRFVTFGREAFENLDRSEPTLASRLAPFAAAMDEHVRALLVAQPRRRCAFESKRNRPRLPFVAMKDDVERRQSSLRAKTFQALGEFRYETSNFDGADTGGYLENECAHNFTVTIGTSDATRVASRFSSSERTMGSMALYASGCSSKRRSLSSQMMRPPPGDRASSARR